jgi:hypothetical protein
VSFNNFSESSLDIVVIFNLDVSDLSAELREREVILLQTMDLMSEMGIAFAFPTRTLQILTALPEDRAVMSSWTASQDVAVGAGPDP